MPDSKNILVGTIPEDGAAVFVAPLGTALPTDATTALADEFIDLGWVSEDGVTNSIKRDTTKHYAWGGDVVRVTQDRYTETIRLALLETNEAVLKVVYGDDAVTTTGTAPNTTVSAVSHSSLQLGRQVFVIDYIDGDKIGRIVIKEGQVTEIGDIKYVHKDLTMYDLTVDCYRPEDGSDAVAQYMGVAAAQAAGAPPSGGDQPTRSTDAEVTLTKSKEPQK